MLAMNNGLSSHLIPNIYDPDHYFKLDIGPGRLENPAGNKMCTLSSFMLRGLYLGLKKETGPAWKLVLSRCGESWGERYADRFLKEIREFYGQDLNTMTMKRFNALVAESLASHGWGRPHFDYSYIERGVITVAVENPILGKVLHDVEENHLDVLLASIFKTVFRKVTGEDLQCLQTQCVSKGHLHSLFIIALQSRMEDVPDMLQEGRTHQEVFDAVLKKIIK